MRRATLAATAAAVMALTACGQRGELRPKSAEAQAPAPYGRDQARSVDDLLTPPAQAAPERTVELHTKSEPRADDPFELPPKD